MSPVAALFASADSAPAPGAELELELEELPPHAANATAAKASTTAAQIGRSRVMGQIVSGPPDAFLKAPVQAPVMPRGARSVHVAGRPYGGVRLRARLRGPNRRLRRFPRPPSRARSQRGNGSRTRADRPLDTRTPDLCDRGRSRPARPGGPARGRLHPRQRAGGHRRQRAVAAGARPPAARGV